MLVGDGLENSHHRVDDGLLVLGQLIEDLGHDLVQLHGPQLRRGAGRPAPVPIDPALPDLLFALGAFQCLPVEAGAVLLAYDLAAVWIAVMELCSDLVGHHLFTAPLVEGVLSCTLNPTPL